MVPSRNTAWHLINAYSPPFLWAGLIFYLSAQSVLPSFTEDMADFVFKKTAHVITYLILYILLFRAHRIVSPHTAHNSRWIVPVLMTLGYAISDEIHQTYTPGRYGTLRDIGFDMLGVGVWFLRQYRYI